MGKKSALLRTGALQVFLFVLELAYQSQASETCRGIRHMDLLSPRAVRGVNEKGLCTPRMWQHINVKW